VLITHHLLLHIAQIKCYTACDKLRSRMIPHHRTSLHPPYAQEYIQ
jgi:hypothetical protein